jgi:ABC-type uncharacterized transport system substrate-binding protein
MDRRMFLGLVTGCLIGAPLIAQPQQTSGRPSRLGYLSSGLSSQFAGNSVIAQLLGHLKEGLSELGYVEGRNLTIEYRVAEGQVDRLPGLADELMRRQVEGIVVIGPAALKAARGATSSVPIVAIDYETDPVASGFVASLGHPGGNVTGIFLDQPEISGKWLELLKDGVPGVSRVAALWDPATPPYQAQAIAAASQTLKIRLQTIKIRRVLELESAFATAARGQAQAIVILSSPLVTRYPKDLADLAIRTRLPTISLFLELAKAGCLFAYRPVQSELFRRLGSFAGRILNGTRPRELPVERPRDLSWPSISRPPRLSASRSRRRCCCGRIN